MHFIYQYLRRGTSLWRSPLAERFTQHDSFNGKNLITEAFNPLFQAAFSKEKQVALEIRQDIVLEAYENALRNRDRPSRVFQLIDAIPQDLGLDGKLSWLANRFEQYPLMPVITVHPTYPLKLQAMIDLCHIVDGLVLLTGNEEDLQDRVKLVQMMREWAEGRLVPLNNLTPKDEGAFALFLYQRILATFPEFYEQVVKYFQKVYGGEYELVSGCLKRPAMKSFRHVFSWCMADFDGNRNRTRETLESTVPSQQNAILVLYLYTLNSILNQLNVEQHLFQRSVLKDLRTDFERCIEAIKAGILFDFAGSRRFKKQVLSKLSSVADSFKTGLLGDEKLSRLVFSLHDLVDLAGFFGGLKEYTRQTTQLNQRVLKELCLFLVDEFKEIKLFMNGRTYEALLPHEKQKILMELSKHPRYFEQLKKDADRFGEETQQELARLSFILEHQDIFPSYIFSDTEGKANLDEVLLLFHFASYLSGGLRIGQIRRYPVNPLILCETPKDMNNFLKTLSAIFADPALRDKMVESHFFSYVGGPSDLGKKGGLLIYFSLLRAFFDASNTLGAYKKEHQELTNVKLRVLNGFGGDMKRRHGAAALELHSTQQKFDAFINLGATLGYLGYLHRVVGHPPESYFRAQELEQLKVNHPKAAHALELIELHGIKKYEVFISSSPNKALLSYLTSFELEKALNISSRAGSKVNLSDPTDIRAIGVVNLYLLTGIQWDNFMSLEGILDLQLDVLSHLKCLFDELTVLKDIVYKTLFSIAVSDFEDAWLRINEAVPTYSQLKEWAELYRVDTMPEDKQLHCMLAHIELRAREILEKSILFFSENQHAGAETYLKNAEHEGLSVNEVALGFMDSFEGEMQQLAEETRARRPYFARLRACVKAYEAHPSEETKENVVLACRGGGWIVTGPRLISEKISPLHQQAILGEKVACLED
ncbi:MAG: phosphoenolpyruvate carboxylase [Gammaproteobacteria bacterium]|nr:phosphoenolpyruvate carboxylase [Gammaproteobacteria bacterium]